MSPAASVLLLLVFLSGECFAGYSTGFRRTPKPKTPHVGRPVVFPSVHTEKHPHWRDDSAEGGKIAVDGGEVGSDKKETPQLDETPDEKTIGSHGGSGIWVPSPAVPPTGEEKETHHFPELPQKEDTSVELDDKTVKVDEVPDYPEELPPSNPHTKEELPPSNPHTKEELPPSNPHTEEELPPWNPLTKEELPPSNPHTKEELPPSNPLTKEELPPSNPHTKEELPPSNPHTKEELPPSNPHIKDLPQPQPDIPEQHEDKQVPIVPGGDSHEVFPDNPLKEDTSDVGPDDGIDLPEELPQPHPDQDEEVPFVPGGDSHEFPDNPPKEDTSDVGPDGGIFVPEKLPEQYPGERLPSGVDDEGAVGIGPLPYPDVPRRDVVIVPPGVKTEVLEPYPVKVANGNINLYELMENLELSRFLHLVEEANLKDLLIAEGPLTIFAPSDYALSKLDASTIRTLATNQELLRQFVLYHLVDGQIYGPSFDERDNSAMVTKFDRTIHINRYGSVWFVNGIPITTRDQICNNGVIHILDSSLYPFPTGDLLETLDKLDNFKIYTELIRNAKLDKDLKGNAVYTIFVPTDAAFSKLPPANLEWLKWDIPAIKRMFRQLTVNGMYYTTWIPSGNGQLTSIDEKTQLSLSGYPDSVNVNGVPLSQYDITANNGCIHTIDDIWFLSELGTSGSSKKKD